MEKTGFKIYSLLLVKNEADIIAYSLTDACRWSDKIIVIDNGSTDGTWEIIQELAKTKPQIVPWLRYEGPFHIGLRAKAYKAFKNEMTANDWWCVRLDADELFNCDVKDFLSHVPRTYQTVSKESTDYILTAEDIDCYQFTGHFDKDVEHIRHFLPHKRRERRFMRHNPLWIWRENWRYPHPWGRVWKEYIPVKHYQYRSPEQMRRRFNTRRQAKNDGCGSFKHEKGNDWKDYILTQQQLDEQNLLYHLPEEFDKSTKTIYKKRNTIKLLGSELVVKRFAAPRFPNNIIYRLFRKSKAERSYIYAQRLKDITPEPVYWKNIIKHGVIKESYYVNRLSKLPYTFMMLSKDMHFPHRERHLQDVARFTARLHKQGIIHNDYSGGNILFDDEGHIEMVDLNRVSFNRKVDIKSGCRNFERLDIEPAACEIMGKAYAKEMGFCEEECIKLIKKYRWKKHKQHTWQ